MHTTAKETFSQHASLESGIFPDQLKITKVVTLYEKRDKRDIQNYIPIGESDV